MYGQTACASTTLRWPSMMVVASPNRTPTTTSAAANPRGAAPFPLRLMCSMRKMGSVPNVVMLSSAGTDVASVQHSLVLAEACTPRAKTTMSVLLPLRTKY